MSYAFPLLTETDKGVQYHRRFVQAITNRCITDDYSNRYAIIQECRKFADEGTSGELTSHLQQNTDGTALPVPWLTLNTLKTKVKVLIGELEERGYDIKVRAFNKEATSRKLEQKEKLKHELKQNSSLPDFIIAARSLEGLARDAFAIKFSFGQNHLHQCRWFVGKPPKKAIAKLLEADGVTTYGS